MFDPYDPPLYGEEPDIQLHTPGSGTTAPVDDSPTTPKPPEREGYSWFWDEKTGTWYSVPITPAPTTPTTTTTGGGMTEEQGRAYDQQHGLVGGYMGPNGWVSGSPSSGGYTPPGPDGGFGDYGAYDTSGFEWPQFEAPRFAAPPAFQFDAFQAPSWESIYDDQSFQGRKKEGLQAIEHGAAAKGLTRLPQTLKSLGAWNQDFASREYGNIFDRSANTWSMNRGNAADAYTKNYGVSRDVFDRNYSGARDQFDFNAFQPAKLTFDDMYRRYRDELDATTRIATAGADGY